MYVTEPCPTPRRLRQWMLALGLAFAAGQATLADGAKRERGAYAKYVLAATPLGVLEPITFDRDEYERFRQDQLAHASSRLVIEAALEDPAVTKTQLTKRHQDP